MGINTNTLAVVKMMMMIDNDFSCFFVLITSRFSLLMCSELLPTVQVVSRDPERATRGLQQVLTTSVARR